MTGGAGLAATLTAAHVATDLGRSLREGFSMFWATLWALVLGFGLSGAVQAFASRDAMQRRLGDHRPLAVTRAAAYGMASSSCSYAASAMARALFARGADFVAAMVFMVASTNLVVELGIVLAVLIGWQFVAAELVGGVVMIVLLVLGGGLWWRGRALAEARALTDAATSAAPGGPAEPAAAGTTSLRRRVLSRSGWVDAAAYTMGDLRMLRKEMALGFVVAGFLSVLVPARAWGDIFLHGHGTWTTLENVAVGPFVAIVSFVCSVGNVPLAAALWKGGISFGGVVSFIFADLLTLPLLLIYRRQYGSRMALRMLGVLWLVMSLAGLATGSLFDALGWVPAGRPSVVAGSSLHFGATTVLDLLALVVLGGLWHLARQQGRHGAVAHARDPVCGMQVDIRHAPAAVVHRGATVHFCSEGCRDRFLEDPQRWLDLPEPGPTPVTLTRKPR